MSWPRAFAAAFSVVCLVLATALAWPLPVVAQDVRPATTSRSERPPKGSWRRGLVPASAATVVVLGALVVIASGAALARRARRSRR